MILNNDTAFHGILRGRKLWELHVRSSVVKQVLKLLCFAQISKHLRKYYITIWQLIFYESSYFFTAHHAQQVSGPVHIENDNGQLVLHAKRESGHIHHL